LWLELTNKCNLNCSHCYAESGPHPSRKDVLVTADYLRLLDEAAGIGCRAVQFIGGEPTLHRGLPELIGHARDVGYEEIEVYTNGTVLTEKLLACFVEHKTSIAVSVYADDAETHDAVTTRVGSHARTISNLRRMVSAGLKIRVGVIAMDANKHRITETVKFLRELGIEKVGVDHARSVGRGERVSHDNAGLQALCGHCWRGSLCVAPDGTASPCVMSKAWSVGSVAETGLADLLLGPQLLEARELIRTEVWLPRQNEIRLQALSTESCVPCAGTCPPETVCTPEECTPTPKCGPKVCTPEGGDVEPKDHPDCYPRNPCGPGGGCDPCHPTCGPSDPGRCTPTCNPPIHAVSRPD